MAEDSTQHWLGRNRPPRVQITYDLETRGAIEKTELPLVVGILADLAGDNETIGTLPDLKTRKFVEIDRDNFNDVMRSLAPTLTIKGEEKPVTFESIDDFTPAGLVRKVTHLREMLEARNSLTKLLVTIEGKDKLSAALYKEGAEKALAAGAPQIPPPPDAPPASDAPGTEGDAK